MRHAPLVTATREFFPPSEAKGHDRAEHIFRTVQSLAGMSDWPCDLEAQASRPGTRVSELGTVKITRGHMPLGTFSVSGNRALITYDPGSIDKPASLVGTLSHELSHYLLRSTHDESPGGELMHEFATDLTTVYLGFGLFRANEAFNFSQFGGGGIQGWSTSGAGYLRERDWAFALAVFCALRGEDVATLKQWLKPYLYKDTQNAARYLAKNPQALAKIKEHQTAYATVEKPKPPPP
ncbi:MAG TPA: hypothetical protein VHZ29_01930 [Rhizomicrobium sp.]|nr:hypothetical protein [Rhizomicrobium sp.]